MNFTLQSMIEALNTLAIGTIYKYASVERASMGACELVSVDQHTGAIKYKRTKIGISPEINAKVESVSGANVAKLASALNSQKAVEINALYGGSGNFRSALEALVANTAHIFVCQIGGKKHIFWNPNNSHPVGQIAVADAPRVYVPTSVGETSYFATTYSRQLITYGAPGTGKSHGIEEIVGRYADTVRTTFHPDSDYASFVGCYKPTVEKRPKYGPQGLPIKVNGVVLTEDVISYSYVPQAFTKAYIRAWSKLSDLDRGNEEKCQFLIIEEINRGNCAQIFGDLFQLLDRRGDGYSKYPIEADADLARYIEGALKALSQETNANIPPEVLSGKKLILPPNLYIWATMNTSDQSLFPMDSAFKRRWDWKYIPIKDAGKNWKIVANGQEFRWWDFLETINKSILEALRSEDKQLGYFFARPDDDVSDVITASKFVNKVLFYLYNDVFKDYELPKGFTKTDGGKFAFADFFLADGEPNETAVKDLLSGLVPLAQPLEVPNE